MRHHNPEDFGLNLHLHENIKSHKFCFTEPYAWTLPVKLTGISEHDVKLHPLFEGVNGIEMIQVRF